jgi:hypothetical protein
MFRAQLAHLQETLHERNQPTSTTAHNRHQTYVPVVSLEDGQVMPETFRDFEP